MRKWLAFSAFWVSLCIGGALLRLWVPYAHISAMDILRFVMILAAPPIFALGIVALRR